MREEIVRQMSRIYCFILNNKQSLRERYGNNYVSLMAGKGVVAHGRDLDDVMAKSLPRYKPVVSVGDIKSEPLTRLLLINSETPMLIQSVDGAINAAEKVFEEDYVI